MKNKIYIYVCVYVIKCIFLMFIYTENRFFILKINCFRVFKLNSIMVFGNNYKIYLFALSIDY